MAGKEWITVQPNLDPILKPVFDIIDAIDSILEFLIALLNIVQFILNIVKMFLMGLLDPIRAIVEAILAEIRELIHNLRQLGVYMAGDWSLLQAPFADLRGGYAAYERRMLGRLLDRTDATRPDFTSASAAVALFVYLSAEDATLLIELIMRIRAFFGAGRPVNTKVYPPPTTPEAKFAASAEAGIGSFKSLGGISDASLAAPAAVNLKWSMPSTGKLFAPSPKGFLIHVSTVPDGFGVQGVVRRKSLDVENIPANFPVGIDPATGTALRLYGGICDLNCDDETYASMGRDDPMAARLYLSVNQNTPLIPPSELLGDTPIGAATYFAKAPLLPTQTYSATLALKDLPKTFTVTASGDSVSVDEEDCRTFYIRVTALTKNYVDALSSTVDGTMRAPKVVPTGSTKPYTINIDTLVGSKGTVLKPEPPTTTLTPYDFSQASGAAVVSFPSDNALGFIEATRAALAVMMMVRPDLDEQEEADGVLKYAPGTYVPGAATGLEGMRSMLGKYGFSVSTAKKISDPAVFQKKIKRAVNNMVTDMLAFPPSDSVIDAMVEEVETLTKFQWNLIDTSWPAVTIMGGVRGEWISPTDGYAATPLGISMDASNRLFYGKQSNPDGLWLTREGYFPQKRHDLSGGGFVMGMGSADHSPVLFRYTDVVGLGGHGVTSEMQVGSGHPLYIAFVRTLLINYDDGAVLKAAAAILQIAGARNWRPPGDGDWLVVRPLEEALAPVIKMVDDLEAYIMAILDGLQGMIDKIIAYIEGIQARIYQIQQLLALIRAIINSLRYFDLPSVSGLVLVENGTDGLVVGLVSSENKPEDSSLSYGGGVVVVAGGLPTLILEIIAAVMAGGD